MTVRTLILLLEKFDPDADVLVLYDGAPQAEVLGVYSHVRGVDDDDDFADGSAILDTESGTGMA